MESRLEQSRPDGGTPSAAVSAGDGTGAKKLQDIGAKAGAAPAANIASGVNGTALGATANGSSPAGVATAPATIPTATAAPSLAGVTAGKSVTPASTATAAHGASAPGPAAAATPAVPPPVAARSATTTPAAPAAPATQAAAAAAAHGAAAPAPPTAPTAAVAGAGDTAAPGTAASTGAAAAGATTAPAAAAAVPGAALAGGAATPAPAAAAPPAAAAAAAAAAASAAAQRAGTPAAAAAAPLAAAAAPAVAAAAAAPANQAPQLAPTPTAAQPSLPTSSVQAPPHLPPTPTALPPTPTASHQVQALTPTAQPALPASALQALPPTPTAQPPPPRPRSSGRHRKKNASCGYHGVQPSGNRFRSYIHLRDETGALKQKALGVFDTVEEAALRVNAAVRMFRPNDLHLLNQVPMAMSAADVAAHNGAPSAATDGADSDVSISSLAENETAYMDDGASGPGSEAYDPSLQAHVRAPPMHNYTGITKNGTKYMAQFNRDGVKLRFGTWDTPIEAALAYNEGIRHLRPDHQHLLNDIPPEEAALYAASQPRRDQYVASAALRLEEARKRPPAAPFTPGNHPKRARTAALALKAELEAGVLSAEAAMANSGAYGGSGGTEYYATAAAAAPMSPPAVAAAVAASAAIGGAAAAAPGAAAAAQQPALAAVDTAAANAHPQAPPPPPPQQQQQQRSTPTSRAPHWTAVPPTSTAQPVGTGFVHDLIVNQAPAAAAAAAAAEPVNSAAAAALRQLTRQADKARTQAALVEHLRTLDASDDVKLEMISNIMGCPRRG